MKRHHIWWLRVVQRLYPLFMISPGRDIVAQKESERKVTEAQKDLAENADNRNVA
jgi:hypothetical protein